MDFNQIPADLKVPFVAAEFDPSRAQQGPALLSYRALLIGQKTGQGTALANSLHRVTTADQVATLAGQGSQLHRMAKAFFRNNAYTEAWIGVLEDASAAVFASGTITVSGPATGAGLIDLYVGGNHLQIAVGSTDTANTIAAAIAAAIGVHASGTVTFATPTTDSDVTVAGVEFLGTSGAVTPGDATYSIDTGGSTSAASFAAQVNAHATTKALVRAIPNAAVVTLRAIAGGTAGNAIVLTSDDPTNAGVSGTGTLAGGAAGQDESLPVHASVNAAVVTLYAKNAGPQGNDINVRASYQFGEELPAGVGLTVSAMASGATVPTLTTLITALGDQWYHVWAHPYTDSTSLTAIEAELSRRFGPLTMIDGVAFTSAKGSQSTLSTLGDTRNSPHNHIVAQPGDNVLAPPCELAAGVAGVVAYYGANDPGRAFNTLEVKGFLPPADADLFTLAQRNLLLGDGIATTKAGADGTIQIERLVTTYQRNAAGSADTAYRDTTTLLVLMYARYLWRVRMSKYARHKLAADGTRFGPGQAVVTPKTIKGEACAWFRDLEELGLVEGFDQFKADLVVQQNGSDPNRLDVLLPPNLINNLIVTATKIQPLL